MKVLIITGGSKGIGEALALKYHAKGYKVFSIARTVNTTSMDIDGITQLTADLSDVDGVDELMEDVFTAIDLKELKQITLVNNAATLGDINRVEYNSTPSIKTSTLLNVATPMALASRFIEKLKETDCRKTILNISSGAAANPYYGWVAYCSTKAALDMITRVVAAEQHSADYPVRALSVSPGIVDTKMQDQIRSADKSAFKLVDKFIELKENNELTPPETVAEQIYTIDQNTSFENGELLDIRSMAMFK